MPDYEKLNNAIDRAEENSYGSDSDGELSAARAKAIDYYLGKMAGAPEGRSNVVDRSVYETIQWQAPSLTRIFANGDDVVMLPPVGPEDEEGAKQESEYLNYLLLQKNNWFQVFDTASKDALLTKAGYLYAYKEKRRQIEIEKYERQTQEGVALIMQDDPQILSGREYPDPDYQPQPMVANGQPVTDLETGQPVMQPPPMLYDIEIRRTKEEVAYCVLALPPERCKVSKDHTEVQLTNCPYFEYYDDCTISYLRSIGLEVPDDISDAEISDTEEDSARNQYSEGTGDNDKIDPSMRRVKTRWIWIQNDYDEDGIAELNYVIRVGQTILHREECNEIPVGVLCPDPLPHRHVGLSAADTALEMQDISTSVLRQGMDNLYLANNPRQFGDPSRVNLDDMLISRPGGVTRTRNGAVFMQDFGVYQVPNVFPNAMEAIEYFKQIREDRTGVSRYFMGSDANALNKTMGGMQQLSTMSAQRVEQIARHFANGIVKLCSVLHSLVLKGGHKKEVVQLRGKWVEIDPATWKKRTDFRISVGYAAGNKDALVGRLTNLAMFQKEALAAQFPIVTPQNVHRTMVELTKASDFATPEAFWTEPSKIPPPPPPQPDPSVVAMEQIKTQSAEKIKGAELVSTERATTEKNQLEKYKADLQANTSIVIEQMRQQHAAGLERFKADHQMGLKDKDKDIEAIKSDESGGAKRAISLERDVEGLKKTLEQNLADANTMIQGVITAGRKLNFNKEGRADSADIIGPSGDVIAQRRIRRDKGGKTTHIDIVAPDGSVIATQTVKRDKSGRAVGVQ